MTRQPSPLITIVMPVYNRANIVTETLDSIAAQTERPLALIIVDNNSTDASLAIVTRWADNNRSNDFTIKIMSESQQGACAARNRGLSATDTPYVMFFDSDDLMMPCHVKDIADILRIDPTIDMVGRDVYYEEFDGKRRIMPFTDTDMLFRHTFNAILSTERYAVKTSFIKEAGGWNVDVPGWNDYELGIRLLLPTPRAKRIDASPAVIARHQVESITGMSYSSNPDKWERSLDICEASLKAAGYRSDAIKLRRVVLAALYRREQSPESRRLLRQVLDSENSFFKKMLYRTAFLYTRWGGRGIHFLLRWPLKLFKDA